MTNEERQARNQLQADYMMVLEGIDAAIKPMYYPAIRVLYCEDIFANGVIGEIEGMNHGEMKSYALLRLLDTHAELTKNK